MTPSAAARQTRRFTLIMIDLLLTPDYIYLDARLDDNLMNAAAIPLII